MTILEDLKAGRLVVVPREAELPPMPDDERIRKLLTDCGHERSMSLYQAFKQVIKETRLALGDTAWPAPDHTKALLSLVEGMERERDAERADAGKWFREYMSLASKGPDGSTRPAFAALEARALAAAQARIRELEEAIWLAHDQLNTYRSAAVEEVIDKLETYIPGLSGKEAPDV